MISNSTYEDFEALSDDDELKINKKTKQKKEKEKEDSNEKKDENNNEDDEFNVSLAKMEEEIKPKILNILDSLNKNYSKLKNIK